MVEELKDNELSTGLLLNEKPASEDLKAAATPSITVTDLSKWHGFDITRKGGKVKKKRYIFALPMMLTNNGGGTLGTVTKMDTPTPVLYIEFPEGRFKCLGRISKTGSRFMPLELTKKCVECKDIIEIMVIFSTVYWVGRAEDNPDEEPLPVPQGLLQAGSAETTLGDVFREGVSKNIKGPQRRTGPRVSKGKAKYEGDDADEEEDDDDDDDDAVDLLGEDDEDCEVEEKRTDKTSVDTSGRKRPAPRCGGRAASPVKKSRRRVSFADDDDDEEEEEGEGDDAMEVDGAGDGEAAKRKNLRRSVRSSSVQVKYKDDESEQDDEQGEGTEDEEQQDGEVDGVKGEEEGGEGSQEEEDGRGKEHDEDGEDGGDGEGDERRARKGRKGRNEQAMGGGAAIQVDDDDDDVEVVEAPKPKRANKARAPKVKPPQRKPLSIPASKRVRRAKEESEDEDDDNEDEEDDDDDDSDFSG